MSLPLFRTSFGATRTFDGQTFHLGRAFDTKEKAKNHAEEIRGTDKTSFGDINRRYARVVEGTIDDGEDAYAVYVANKINP